MIAWRLYRFSLPLVRPLTTSAGATREGLLLALDDGSAIGWGEGSPLPGLHRETRREVAAELAGWLSARPTLPADFRELHAQLSPTAALAVEGAVWDLRARREGRRPAALLAPAPAPAVPVQGLIDGPDAAGQARDLAEAGYAAVKIKVGRRPFAEEIADVAAARAAAPGLALRLDANRAFDLPTAIRLGRAIADLDVAYVEEPLADPRDLAAFYHETGVRTALDESLAEGLVIPAGAAALVIKPSVVGGLAAALRWVALAQSRGLSPILSATFESGVGLALLAELAATQGAGLPPQGLDTGRWLAADVRDPPLAPGPWLTPTPGEVRLEALESLASGVLPRPPPRGLAS